MENVEYNIDLQETLGQGAYGIVYGAKLNEDISDNGNDYAIKKCHQDQYGIQSLLEASILTIFDHPCINKATAIGSNDQYTYIVSEQAVCDLARKTRKSKHRIAPTITQLQKWIYQAIQALAVLHTENIIHGDVKASNLLLYDNDKVRLTDFSLSTYKLNKDDTFTYTVCTHTHRPLECFLEQPWNEKLDIWSLGCTMYELAYGELLFPYQVTISENRHMKNASKSETHKIRKRLNERSINCLLNWQKTNFPYMKQPIEFYDEIYDPHLFCDSFYNIDMTEYNRILLSCLHSDPNNRPDIFELLTDSFFKDIDIPLYSYTLHKCAINYNINDTEKQRVNDLFDRFSIKINIRDLAFKIYCCCTDIGDVCEETKALTSAWLAHKIIYGIAEISKAYDKNRIIRAERKLCHYLGFRLHC